MNNIEAADLVDSIREVLAEVGWTQGGYSDAHGRLCLLGAGRKVKLGYVIASSENGMQVYSTDQETGIALGMPCDVARFNDTVATCWEDVDTMLVNRSKELRELG